MTGLAAAGMMAATLSVAEAQLASPAAPQPVPMPPAIAAPRDTAFPGTITLEVDASDIDRRIFSVRETIPVTAGPLTLLYPQWLPGNHAPRGRVDKLAGLTITGNGQRLAWRRDDANVFAFHVDVPAGVTTLELSFQFLSPTDSNQGRIVMTPEMLNLQWNTVVLYAAGYFARQIPVAASVVLPPEWSYATSLKPSSRAGSRIAFETAPLETVVDSPMFAGRYAVIHDLGSLNGAPVRLNVFADEPGHLAAKAEQIEAHRNLVIETGRAFGRPHFQSYEFLLALTDRMGGIGLEHSSSSENGTDPGYFTEWNRTAPGRDLLPHELAHSWNGKFRRPADLWIANFNTPMRNGLLWVYEGQTQYWGVILAARAGLISKAQALESLAATAALYDQRVGRAWKPLQDTTNDPITTARQPMPWRSWQRSEDYYSEGLLLWLDADTLIREKTRGRKSLDDFAKLFFGARADAAGPSTYSFDDLVGALNQIVAHDWRTFLRDRLDGHGPGAPLDGLRRGGYILAFAEEPTSFFKDADSQSKLQTFSYSLGLTIGREGRLTDVLWDGPAHKAGLTVGSQIVAVNGIAYDVERLKTAITDGKQSTSPMEFLIKNGDHYRTVAIDYRGGLRYPRLERTGSGTAILDQILAPRK